ncbi:uncharacterized protein [Venturia canescens]|uniref:uncharacterized protein n=1 Tax=Venturia canescens TaxID=32260 RepID=UPI001C9CA06B|nr:uncharacterized protein LOC122413155 [Venturia canescens]
MKSSNLRWIYLICIIEGISNQEITQKQHKRQIYREQVLPALGGKIPEEAFRTDRLALNRLNKQGITVIDGVLLEAREDGKHPDNVRSKPEIIQVYVTQDSRYVPPEGRAHNDRPKSVDTTYVIRKPICGHCDHTERSRLNGIPTSLPEQRSNDRHQHSRPGTQVRIPQNTGGYREPGIFPGAKAAAPPSRQGAANPQKSQGYANYHRFYPPVTTNGLLQQQRHYQTIYKPIVTPLVIPARELTFSKGNNVYHKVNEHPPSWQLNYDWRPFYQQTPIVLQDSGDLFFNSHQIFTDYEGFFNGFHGRSYRHIDPLNKGSEKIFLKDSKGESGEKNILNLEQRTSVNGTTGKWKIPKFSSVSNGKLLTTYTDLPSIPETSFSCSGRKGTFADVETNCQVFHECSGWSKTSSLCPIGTAYSVSKKRCEWWDTVTCGSEYPEGGCSALETYGPGAVTVYLNVKLYSIMAASTAKLTSYRDTFSIIAIFYLVGCDVAMTQDHRFRINVYDDYPQEQPTQYQNYRQYQYEDQYENLQDDRYQKPQVDRYQKPQEDRYHNRYEEPYRQPYQQYQERYQPVYKKPVEPKKKSKEQQDFSKIPGVPGVDFPIYHTVPHTSFSCSKVPYLPGMYANVETGCQAYHTCHDGREGDQGAAFLCSNGTLFNQHEFACDWWYNVNCNDATKLYKLNGDATTNPFVPKAKKDEILAERLKIVVF